MTGQSHVQACSDLCLHSGRRPIIGERERGRDRETKRDRSVFAHPRLCSPVFGSTLPAIMLLQSLFPLSILLLN